MHPWKSVTTLMVFLCVALSLVAQTERHPIAADLAARQSVFRRLPVTDLLRPTAPPAGRARLSDDLSSASFLQPNASTITALLRQGSEELQFRLPLADGPDWLLQLRRADIFTPDFRLTAASRPGQALPYRRGVYYWGVVAGHPNSLAAIAITADEVMGTIHIDGESYNLGRLRTATATTHILYAASQLSNPPQLGCDTDDLAHYIGSGTSSGGRSPGEADANRCVRMYLEATHDVYLDKGSVEGAADFLSGLFSQAALLFANERVKITISEIKVWDTREPYDGKSPYAIMEQFRRRLAGKYNGDLAHLIGFRGSGGIAYVDALCNPYYGVGYSGIGNTFTQAPTFSWSVEVLTHEIGHNLGSPHTHACAWNGNSTPLDGCGMALGYGEGCAAEVPTRGTIMSYCHLLSGVGIDFGLGFGPQPGDLIRDRVYHGECLTPCQTEPLHDVAVTAILAPGDLLCADSLQPQIELTNFGRDTLRSVTIKYSCPDSSLLTYNWTGHLAHLASVRLTLPALAVANGPQVFRVRTERPNGQDDENPANDQQSAAFNRATEWTYYADADGDGYGSPDSLVRTCTAPAGFVTNATDCHDGDASRYPGAPCDDGDACTINDTYDANCDCRGTYVDSDADGICDAEDICPRGDDRVDSDGDGIPNACDDRYCTNELQSLFADSIFQHRGTAFGKLRLDFPEGNSDASFSISGLSARLDGDPSRRYNEAVTVLHIDETGNYITYNRYLGSEVDAIDIRVEGVVRSVIILLADALDGDSGSETMQIRLSPVISCLRPNAGLPLVASMAEVGLYLYPNPTNGETLLTFQEAPRNATVVVRDLLGRQLATHTLQGENSLRLSAAAWPAAGNIFFITVQADDAEPVTHRLLVERG